MNPLEVFIAADDAIPLDDKRVGAGRAALTSYMVPVGTLILAAVLLGEHVAPLQLAGGALTLVGMRIATLPERDAFWLRRLVGI